MQRAIIDTNTWVSGLLWSGAPRQVVQLVLNRELHCSSSSELVVELERVLNYPRIGRVLVNAVGGTGELRSKEVIAGVKCFEINSYSRTSHKRNKAFLYKFSQPRYNANRTPAASNCATISA